MRIKSESYFTLSMIAISFSAGVYALLKWDFKTALVPVFCGGVIFVLCCYQFVKELRGGVSESSRIMDFGFDKNTSSEKENLFGAIKYFGILVGLYISIYIVGIYAGVGFFVLLYLLASRQVSATKSIVVAGAVVGVVYFIINEIAQEALPDPLIYKLLF